MEDRASWVEASFEVWLPGAARSRCRSPGARGVMWKPPWKPLLELIPQAAASARGEHGWVLGAQGPLSPSPGCGKVLGKKSWP